MDWSFVRAMAAASVALVLGSGVALAAGGTITSPGGGSRQPEMTPEQLRRVPPVPLYQPPNPPLAGVNPESAPGLPGSRPGTPPDPGADAAARREFPEAWRQMGGPERAGSQGGAAPTPEGTNNVFTAYCANCEDSERTRIVHRQVGRLFSSGGACTATVISRNNIAVTAAHCCYNRATRTFNTNFRFFPAYRNGEFAPYGSFTASRVRVLPTWLSRGARQDDVCLVRLNPNQFGRPVTFYTGSAGTAWNQPTVLNVHSLGYPGNIGGGQFLQLCTAETSAPPLSCGGATTLNMGCNMTNGSSGGPWFLRYRAPGGSFVTSVVSGYDGPSCTGAVGLTYNGGRFTTENIAPLCSAEGC